MRVVCVYEEGYLILVNDIEFFFCFCFPSLSMYAEIDLCTKYICNK